MATLGSSSAHLNEHQVLRQHQVAQSFVRERVMNAGTTTFRWLDLGVGRGQILVNLSDTLSSGCRQKIHFVGFDAKGAHCREAERIASTQNLGSVRFHVGNLDAIADEPQLTGAWDFITLTNVIHELNPHAIPKLLVECLRRLAHDGCLFVYDMESLSPLELGAVTWKRDEIRALLKTIMRCLGVDAEPEVAKWPHASCDCWEIQLRPAAVGFPSDWKNRGDDAINEANDTIRAILKTKMEQIKDMLEILTRDAPQTPEEVAQRDQYLFDFWAVSRKLGGQP